LNRVLFVAPATAARECDWLRDELRPLDAAVQPETFATLSDAARWLRQHGSQGATVIVVQSTPDEYTADEVSALIGEFPQTRVMSAYGPWCVSDGRTRSIWPEACRVPLTSVPALLRAEQSYFRQRRTTPNARPPRPTAHSPLAAPEELAAWQSYLLWNDVERPAEPATILVLSDDRVLRETLAAATTAWGHTTRHASTRTTARLITAATAAAAFSEDVVILDIDDAAEDVRTILEHIRAPAVVVNPPGNVLNSPQNDLNSPELVVIPSKNVIPWKNDVIPAQAGIQSAAMDSRLRGNDVPAERSGNDSRQAALHSTTPRPQSFFITGFPALSLHPVLSAATERVFVIPKTDLLLRLRDGLRQWKSAQPF
jgi:CheY-like chemotaxis protein